MHPSLHLLPETYHKKLDADVFINGSINQSGLTIRLNAQLFDSKTEDVLKPFQIDGAAKNILHLIDSLSVMLKNYLIISNLEKEVGQAIITGIYTRRVTNSPEAYRYFIYGNNAFQQDRDYSTARNWYLKAIAIDSNFFSATNFLVATYFNQGLYDEMKNGVRNYTKRDQMPLLQQLMINDMHALLFETPYEVIKWETQILRFDDQQPITYYLLGLRYNSVNQYNNAIPEFEKALEIYDKWESKPWWVYNYTLLGFAYHKTEQYKKEKELYKKAEHDFPGDRELLRNQSVLSLTDGDTISANKYIEKYITTLKENSVSEASIMNSIAVIYSEAGILDKAEEYYRKALFLEPENSVRSNNLAYFLIDKDRNVNVGIELVEMALELNPDNYSYLHTKGWGFYKTGKISGSIRYSPEKLGFKERTGYI